MTVNIRDLMEEIKGATFIGVTYDSTPKIKGGKKNPFVGNTIKHVIGANAQVFTNAVKNGYEQKVKRRLVAEGKDPGTFELGRRAWGVRLDGMPIIEHKGEYYLELIFNSSGKVSFSYNGESVERDIIQGLEDKREGEQGGLSDKVIIRTIKLSNIKELRINKNVIQNPFFS